MIKINKINLSVDLLDTWLFFVIWLFFSSLPLLFINQITSFCVFFISLTSLIFFQFLIYFLHFNYLKNCFIVHYSCWILFLDIFVLFFVCVCVWSVVGLLGGKLLERRGKQQKWRQSWCFLWIIKLIDKGNQGSLDTFCLSLQMSLEKLEELLKEHGNAH